MTPLSDSAIANRISSDALRSSPSPSPTPAPALAPGSPRPSRRNFGLLALHQAIMRTGWIFKTESIVMPAVLDSLSGAAWVRGFLPMLNRIGQSIPPILAAGAVSNLPRKKYFLIACSTLMGAVFLFMAWFWRNATSIDSATMTGWFLLMYLLFFVGVGLHQMTLSTVNGKLVAANRRGKLLALANLLGGVGAILCAALLMSRWLGQGRGGFVWIFLFAGITFVAAGGSVLALREHREQARPRSKPWRHGLSRIVERLRNHADLRKLMVVAMFFGASYTLFPHYQSMGRDRLQLGLEQLVPWMIAQNIGVTMFSLPIGWLADRWGNRLALQFLLLASMLAPLGAMELSRFPAIGVPGFSFVFLLLGFMPITMRVVTNYALELADTHDQPLYVSLTSLAMSVPVILGSTIIGFCMDTLGMDACFWTIIIALFCAFLLSRHIREPRQLPLAYSAEFPGELS